ncbi:hypothetical protein [Winogradskyella flava]|uniref:hypothetical protein n=1 Tax=Winogradskyella flava TaxID=1884876 RepID=UPI002491FEBB|nr:hypothetical protein [Winogradskyella flava]
MKALLYIFIFTSLEIFACDCDILNPTMEFYESEYVFKGIAKEKVYSQDSLTYRVTFKILNHYKQNGSEPKSLSFTLRAESQFTGEWTLCDWSIYKNQTWLVYAHKNSSDGLVFSGICSNSRVLDRVPLSQREAEVLKEANNFELNKYIYKNELSFNHTSPKIDLDDFTAKTDTLKDYKKSFIRLILYIDSQGNLLDIIPRYNLKQEIDKINGLTKKIINIKKNALSPLEKDAIALLSKNKKWGIKKHKKTNIAVNYLKDISITYDAKSNKWNYEF